jgi:hypothetical protein
MARLADGLLTEIGGHRDPKPSFLGARAKFRHQAFTQLGCDLFDLLAHRGAVIEEKQDVGAHRRDLRAHTLPGLTVGLDPNAVMRGWLRALIAVEWLAHHERRAPAAKRAQGTPRSTEQRGASSSQT